MYQSSSCLVKQKIDSGLEHFLLLEFLAQHSASMHQCALRDAAAEVCGFYPWKRAVRWSTMNRNNGIMYCFAG